MRYTINSDTFYLKAKNAYLKCISSDENSFLRKEIDIPIKSIILRNESISIKFSQNNEDSYVIKISINLLNKQDRIIGNYFYFEDHNGNAIDDMLVIK